MGGPLRIEEILHLATGAVGIQAAAGVIDGQRGKPRNRRADRLRLGDAEIWTDGVGRLQRHTRSAGQSKLPQRNDGIQEYVAGDAGFAAKTLANLGAQAQPGHRPVLREATGLDRVIDVSQSIQRGIGRRFALPNQLADWAKLKLAEIKNAEAETVARAEELGRRAGLANAEKRHDGKGKSALGGAWPGRNDAGLEAYRHRPFRLRWRIDRRSSGRFRRGRRQVGRRGD